MSLYSRYSAAVLFASALAAGTLAAGSANADSWRTDCLGNNCVRTHCDDSDACTTATNYTTRSARTTTSWSDDNTYHRVYTSEVPPAKPMRYACDYDGDNCHWTRSYFLDEDGVPIFDPGMTP